MWIEAAKLAASHGEQSEVYDAETHGWNIDSFLVDEVKSAMFKLSALAALVGRTGLLSGY